MYNFIISKIPDDEKPIRVKEKETAHIGGIKVRPTRYAIYFSDVNPLEKNTIWINNHLKDRKKAETWGSLRRSRVPSHGEYESSIYLPNLEYKEVKFPTFTLHIRPVRSANN